MGEGRASGIWMRICYIVNFRSSMCTSLLYLLSKVVVPVPLTTPPHDSSNF
jgi:hypothetical protein